MVNGLLLMINYSDWLQMENSVGLRTENDIGNLQNYSNVLYTKSNNGRL